MKILASLGKIVLVVAVVFSTATSLYLYLEVRKLKSPEISPVPVESVFKPSTSDVDLTVYATKDYVDESVSKVESQKPEPETKTVTIIQKEVSPAA